MSDEITTWRYTFPNDESRNGGGWAIVFLDSQGCFSGLSDYGNVAYRWPMAGQVPGREFREFLLGCDDYYLTLKLGQGRKEYDPKGTLQMVKEHILRYRRDDSLTKAEAREEWNRLETYDNLAREFDFSQWYTATGIEDAGEFYCQRYDTDVTAFVEMVMPRLRERMRADLGLTNPTPVDKSPSHERTEDRQS